MITLGSFPPPWFRSPIHTIASLVHHDMARIWREPAGPVSEAKRICPLYGLWRRKKTIIARPYPRYRYFKEGHTLAPFVLFGFCSAHRSRNPYN
ncbi:hypothetical protein PG995_015596 [Apiospora arundinis]